MNQLSQTIVTFAGDGIGPEVMAEATKVLAAVGDRFERHFTTESRLLGGAAIDAYGAPLRPADLTLCRKADAILLGAVGGPKWDNPNSSVRPEQGLLALRKGLGLFANLRPVKVSEALAETSPIKTDLVRDVDLIVVRELTGGIYFGRPSRQWRERRGSVAVDTLVYREHEIERVMRLAFEIARTRRGAVASVDKANVLSSSRLWRRVASAVAADYPDVRCEHILVDAMAMHLVRHPARYDVIVTENMFGDILTDEASVLTGSIGLLPSASLGARRTANGEGRFGLFEPIHGSAPDIAGQGLANPVGMILSVALMLRTSLGFEEEASAVEAAVEATVVAGTVTGDVALANRTMVSTSMFGDAVASRIANA